MNTNIIGKCLRLYLIWNRWSQAYIKFALVIHTITQPNRLCKEWAGKYVKANKAPIVIKQFLLFALQLTYTRSSDAPMLARDWWTSSNGTLCLADFESLPTGCRTFQRPCVAKSDWSPGWLHFGPLLPIHFISWLWNGQNWTKGSYPN